MEGSVLVFQCVSHWLNYWAREILTALLGGVGTWRVGRLNVAVCEALTARYYSRVKNSGPRGSCFANFFFDCVIHSQLSFLIII